MRKYSGESHSKKQEKDYFNNAKKNKKTKKQKQKSARKRRVINANTILIF